MRDKAELLWFIFQEYITPSWCHYVRKYKHVVLGMLSDNFRGLQSFSSSAGEWISFPCSDCSSWRKDDSGWEVGLLYFLIIFHHHSFFVCLYFFHILNLLSSLSSHRFSGMICSFMPSSIPYNHAFFLPGGFHLKAFLVVSPPPSFLHDHTMENVFNFFKFYYDHPWVQ